MGRFDEVIFAPQAVDAIYRNALVKIAERIAEQVCRDRFTTKPLPLLAPI